MLNSNHEQTSSPFVSVIINCYNGENYISEAIKCVLSQTFADFELIVWNNRSTDSTQKLVESFRDSRIRHYLAKQHSTLAEARNKAVEKTYGQWIAFLDCDDLWKVEKLQKQVELIRRNPENLGLVYGRSGLIANNAAFGEKKIVRLRHFYLNRNLPGANAFNELLRYNNFFVFSSVMIKKESYVRVGGIDPQYKYAEDYDLLLKIGEKHRIMKIDEVIVDYRIHDSNLTFRYTRELLCESLSVLNKYRKYPLSGGGINRINIQLSMIELKKGNILSFLSYYHSLSIIKSFFEMVNEKRKKYRK